MFPIPVYAIWWNNNWDKSLITKISLEENSNLELWDTTYDVLELDNRKIFITHYPMIVKSLAKSWDFDAIFYGHNHSKHKEIINNCLVVNPWEIAASKTWIASYAIYDTETNDAEIIEVENSITTNTKECQEIFSRINKL